MIAVCKKPVSKNLIVVITVDIRLTESSFSGFESRMFDRIESLEPRNSEESNTLKIKTNPQCPAEMLEDL